MISCTPFQSIASCLDRFKLVGVIVRRTSSRGGGERPRYLNFPSKLHILNGFANNAMTPLSNAARSDVFSCRYYRPERRPCSTIERGVQDFHTTKCTVQIIKINLANFTPYSRAIALRLTAGETRVDTSDAVNIENTLRKRATKKEPREAHGARQAED